MGDSLLPVRVLLNGTPGNTPDADYYPETRVVQKTVRVAAIARRPRTGPLGVPPANFVACSGATTDNVDSPGVGFKGSRVR